MERCLDVQQSTLTRGSVLSLSLSLSFSTSFFLPICASPVVFTYGAMVCCASAPSSSDEYGNNKCKEEPDIDDDVVMDHGEMKRGIEEAAGFSDTTDILAVCCAWAF